MTDKQVIKQQQAALVKAERALMESRSLVAEAYDDITSGRAKIGEHKLRNYLRKVGVHGQA